MNLDLTKDETQFLKDLLLPILQSTPRGYEGSSDRDWNRQHARSIWEKIRDDQYAGN